MWPPAGRAALTRPGVFGPGVCRDVNAEQVSTLAWAAFGLLAAILGCMGLAFWGLYYAYRHIIKGLREDVVYHQRQLTELRTLLGQEREDCEARLARLAARVEELERRLGIRE